MIFEMGITYLTPEDYNVNYKILVLICFNVYIIVSE